MKNSFLGSFRTFLSFATDQLKLRLSITIAVPFFVLLPLLAVAYSFPVLALATQNSDIPTLTIERRCHTATQLADGRILIVGGENKSGPVSESEIFDTDSRRLSRWAKLIIPRVDHTATLLADGRVLIVGGRGQLGILDSTEIFDPNTYSFINGPPLHSARAGHTATPLANGTVLIVGGDAVGSAEIFDPKTQSFTLLGSRLAVTRVFHSAVLLQNGKVLIAGGQTSSGAVFLSADVFNPDTLSFAPARNRMQVARSHPSLRVLPDGKVQVIGGDDEHSMEMFNPKGEYFSAYARLLSQSSSVPEVFDRSDHSLTEIPQSNQTLLTGGVDSSGQVLKSTILFASSPATVTTDKTNYVASEVVIITGNGWQPGETVLMTIHEDPTNYPDRTLSSVADANGSFTNKDFTIPQGEDGVTFTLTAKGQSSAYTAQTTFTDADPDQSSVLKVTGGGEIDRDTGGGVASFGFNAKQTTPVSGQFDYIDHVTGLHIKGTYDTVSTCGTSCQCPNSDNSVTFAGPCGDGCTFKVTVQDVAEPGANADMFGISVVLGTQSYIQTCKPLKHGNIQRHF
jgi:hypothetical protein